MDQNLEFLMVQTTTMNQKMEQLKAEIQMMDQNKAQTIAMNQELEHIMTQVHVAAKDIRVYAPECIH